MKIKHDFTTNNREQLPFIEETGLFTMKIAGVSTKDFEEKGKIGLILNNEDETKSAFLAIYMTKSDGTKNGFATFQLNAIREFNGLAKYDANVVFDTDELKGLFVPIEIVEDVYNGKLLYKPEVISVNSIPWFVGEGEDAALEYAQKQEVFKAFHNELTKDAVEAEIDSLTEIDL